MGRVWQAKGAARPEEGAERDEERDEEDWHSEWAGPWDQAEEPEPVAEGTDTKVASYIKELGLDGARAAADEGASLEIDLPLTETPHLTTKQCRGLRQWAKRVQWSTLPNGLGDAGAVDAAQVPLDLEQLCPRARGLVESAIGDLRRRIEEQNVHRIQNGCCRRGAQQVVLKLQVEGADAAEEVARSSFGVTLDGLCRAVAAFDAVLGPGGPGLLQRGRRTLREWIRQENTQRCDFDPQEAYTHVHDSLPGETSEHKRHLLAVMAVASHRAVRADLARERSGEEGEATLESRLQNAGVDREEYLTEEDLRSVQSRLFGIGKTPFATPDVLFRRRVVINQAQTIHWIDSKGTCLLPGFAFASQIQKLQRQLANFVELFGPGLVIWRGGFAHAATERLEGVHFGTWPSPRDVRGVEDAQEVQEVQEMQDSEPCVNKGSPSQAVREAWLQWQ